MVQNTTRSLSRKLQSIKDVSDAESFIKDYSIKVSLHGFLNEIMAANEISIPELIDRSGISKNYIYNILDGKRRNPGRDKIIAICIGLGASFSQTNKALESAKCSALYPRDERDARIAIAINNGIRKVTDVNIILEQNSLQPLDV